MLKNKPNDNRANDINNFLSTVDGQLIELDTPAFLNWLEANDSFRFEAGVGGENSYRARKEKGNYWYAVKKVKGKLHKRFIGKLGEVTHKRLIEVAEKITQPPLPRKTDHNKAILDGDDGSTSQPESTSIDNAIQQQQTQIDELRQLLANQSEEIRQLRQLLLNLQPQAENAAHSNNEANLEAENRLLQEENQKLHNKVAELTKQLEDNIVNHDNQVRQLQERIDQLELEKTALHQSTVPVPDYEAIADRVLNKLKSGKQSMAGKAIDAFVKELAKRPGHEKARS